MLENILDSLGVRPLINASATQTPLGGSIMNERVVRAMGEASQHFFDLRELHAAVGSRIASLTRNEDAMVSAGVASAIYLVTMALIKVTDPESFSQIPARFPEGVSVIAYRPHCVEYVCGIEQAGVKLRVIGESGGAPDERAELLEAEILRQKPLYVLYVMAGLWIPPGAPSLPEAVRVCRKYGVPLVLDAAAQLPPKSNLWTLTAQGVSVVLFSGGKDLQGPSHTGLVLGNREIVSACREIISPTEGVGRFFKIGKEELIAALVAVEEYMARDEKARLAWCEEQVARLVSALGDIPGVTVTRAYPNEAGQPIPRASVVYDQNMYPIDPSDLVEAFMKRPVRIAFLLNPGKGFYCNPMTMKDGETEILIREIKAYFTSQSR